MKNRISYFILSAVVLFIILNVGCKKEIVTGDVAGPTLPEAPYNYVNNNFSFWPFDNEPDNNRASDAGATLGRVLFYDKKLSLNNTVACATCHKQQFAFADNKASSIGFEGKITSRNSMTIINPGMSHGYFWDIRADKLEDQVLMPVKNHIEMGLENLDNLEIKLAKLDYYPPLFEAAFGTTEITRDNISKALAQFLRSMASYRSKYDKGLENDFSNFTALERMGKDLFESWDMPCQSCHGGTNFDGWGGGVSNIGLDEVYTDNGLGALSQWQAQGSFYDGMFKVPSLRNVAVTAPYMHDGRFNTLEEVIEHYDSGVKKHPNLDYRLTTGGFFIFNDNAFEDPVPGTIVDGEPRKLNLTDLQKRALVAFLETLTDYELIRDPKFSDPFK